ncbi:hypothetical protein Cni_G18494 [Canna indica]|uniref:Protein kinase domain-containing protein n=1 Tax=Canna indica TaxID=4628 RepID=A0AAQ3QEE5_9LILI|nr:hypothetical protein Cni_G18494 [Canna indica]
MPKQCPPNSADANVRPPEVSLSGVPGPVLNYSIQTGEEFALEFMRERATPKKPTIQNAHGNQNMTNNYMDVKNMPSMPQMGSRSASDLSVLATGDKHQMETKKKNLAETEHKGQFASSRSIPQVSSGQGSNQTLPHEYTSSKASDVSSKRLKFLCSFGGKILPRPGDGKLRYVGGDTRILRVNKDISWEELMQKTLAMYSRPHIIKYQLPGEDLDALISVSCYEDLQNMIEEYSVLEGGEGSQKLRMFLFTSDDIDDVQFSFGGMEGDSEIQYVVAVNGMDLGSGRSSCGHGLASTSASDLDQLLNLNVESERANAYAVMMQSAGFVTAPISSPATFTPALQATSYSYYDSHSQGFENQRYHYAYNPINSPNGYEHSNSRMSISLSVPSHYHFSSNNTNIGASIQPSQQSLYQRVTNAPHSGVTGKKDVDQAVDNFTPKNVDTGHIGYHIIEPTSNIQQADVSVSSHMFAENMYFVAAQEDLISVLPSENKGKQMDPAPSLSANPVNAGRGSDLNEDDHFSSGALASDNFDDEADLTYLCHNNPPSRPSRGYQSERLPTKQAEFLNRKTKSDDSIGSQYLINQACLIAAQESISEAVEGELGSQTEKSLSSAKPPRPCNATKEDDLMHFEKNMKIGNIIQANKFEPVSSLQGSEVTKFSKPMNSLTNQAIHNQDEVGSSIVLPGSDQNDNIVDEKSYKQGRKIQKPGFEVAPSKSTYDKPTVLEDRIFQDSNVGRHMEATNVGETDIVKVNNKDVHVDGSFNKQLEVPVSTDIIENAPAIGQVESSVGALSQEESSAPSMERKDILIDINDRFPPNLLSDIFNKAKIAEDLANINPIHKGDAGLSLNLQNHDPKSWSFFRNLAQHEFNHKDFSLMDQDHISYQSLLPKVEEEISLSYQFAPLENERVAFDEEMQESSSSIIEDPTILHPDYIPSQVPHPLVMDKGEGLQVENPFTKLGETLRTHISENEELRFEGGETAEPDLDGSLYDIDLSNLQIIKNEDLEELRELGSGTFGTVYHGKWRGTDVAIKRIKKSCFTGRSSEQERLTVEFWREAEILSQLHHPNVVAFYGVVKDGPGGTMATVTEFMVNGSLRHVLLRKDKYLDRRKRLIIAMDAAFGMEYLHSKNIVHFDLKCDNLLVNLKDQSRPICKVGDFGLSKIKRNTLVSGGVRGTLPWMAPELLNGSSNKVSEKVDVFSFGIVMWEILTGEEPYANMHYGAIIGGIVNNTLRPPVPANCDPEWRRLMEQCWAPDPVKRPCFSQIAGRLRAMSVASLMKPAK